MSDSELMELLGSMSKTTLNSPEELTTFQEDLNNIHRELARRSTGSTSVSKSSETATPSPAIASAGFAVGNKSAIPWV